MNRSFVTLVLAMGVTGAALTLEAQQQFNGNRSVGHSPGLVRQFVGGGRWQSHARENGQQGWHVQMKHFDDDSLTGRVNLVGAVLDHATIQGQVTGQEVDGVLLDDHGIQVGTFSGVISTSGISGTYTTANGDSGDWSWDGAVPGN